MSHQILFDDRYVYAGDSVTVQIGLTPVTGVPFLINATLDTGAVITAFDISLVRRLGIADVAAGAPTTVRLPNNQLVPAYIHDVTIEIFGHEMTIPVVFCPSFPPGTDNLLGMRGFFEQIRVAFLHGEHTLSYRFG